METVRVGIVGLGRLGAFTRGTSRRIFRLPSHCGMLDPSGRAAMGGTAPRSSRAVHKLLRKWSTAPTSTR